MPARTLAAACAAVLLAACGQDGTASLARRTPGTPSATTSPAPVPATTSPVPPPASSAAPETTPPLTARPATTPPFEPLGPHARRDPDQVYEVTTSVLESPEHGPELCVGGMAQSLPPQCGGVPVQPFSWSQVEGEESANGTTWGTARFVGTFDGRVFHLTEPPSRPRRESPPPAEGTFPTACREPAGGWVTDRDKAGADDQDAAAAYANQQPDVAGVWLSYPDGPPGSDEYDAFTGAVLNLAFTGDLDRHRREARELWGGGLCVTRLPRSRAALSRVQDDLTAAREEAARGGVYVYGSSVDEVGNVVSATVLIADAAAQQWVDGRYRPGWVELDGIFRPVR